MQTQSELRRRIDKALREQEAREARKALEKSLVDQLSLGGNSQKQPRGHAAKEQEKGTKPEPKKTATKSEKQTCTRGRRFRGREACQAVEKCGEKIQSWREKIQSWREKIDQKYFEKGATGGRDP